jgi:UDP-glucose 4-epimerase
MRAVVTGGAGFIGSNLVDALVADGSEVLVLDDLSRGREANLPPQARLARVDVRDGAAVHKEITGFAPEVVFHLAAQIDVRTSMDEPARDAHTNVIGSLHVFAAARAAGVRRVVNTSTGGAIYGETGVVPTPETEPARPLSAYGLGKRTAEEYGAWFGHAHGLPVTTLRYGNVYGPRQDPDVGAGVIAILCERALRGARPVVFGDGRQTRDYVAVGDIVAANLAAARAGRPAHDVYNVGTGTEVDLLQLVAAVGTAAGLPAGAFAPEFRPERAGEVRRSCLDSSQNRADFGDDMNVHLQCRDTTQSQGFDGAHRARWHDACMSASEGSGTGHTANDHESAAVTHQIGEVARRVGLSIRTIRHWEEMGLVTPTARSAGGFRLYSDEDISRMRLLRFMKPLDLSLDQMRDVLRIRELLAATTASQEDRVEALVWPRTSDTDADRSVLAAQLSELADLADRRLEKLRRYIEEVEEFLGRLRDEVREGLSSEGAHPFTGGA